MKRAIQIIDFDELQPGVEPCRDERCPVDGLHPAHLVVGRRGRTSATCPHCFKPVKRINSKTIVCTVCNWSRTKIPNKES